MRPAALLSAKPETVHQPFTRSCLTPSRERFGCRLGCSGIDTVISCFDIDHLKEIRFFEGFTDTELQRVGELVEVVDAESGCASHRPG